MLFEINEDKVQIPLMFKIFFTQESEVKNLYCGASPGSEPSLFISENLVSLGFEPIQDDFQHGFTWMTDEAGRAVTFPF